MKRYAVSLLIVFCVIFGTSPFAADSAAADYGNGSLRSFSNSEDTFLLHESLAVTQDDLKNNFLEYAEISAAVSMPAALQNSSSVSSRTANVVGIVLDYDTELPVSEAAVSIDGVPVVSTGTDGRFQISSIPSGQYNWSISANDYCSANYTNYSVDPADGVTIFTFYINAAAPIVKDREISAAHTREQTVPPNH